MGDGPVDADEYRRVMGEGRVQDEEVVRTIKLQRDEARADLKKLQSLYQVELQATLEAAGEVYAPVLTTFPDDAIPAVQRLRRRALEAGFANDTMVERVGDLEVHAGDLEGQRGEAIRRRALAEMRADRAEAQRDEAEDRVVALAEATLKLSIANAKRVVALWASRYLNNRCASCGADATLDCYEDCFWMMEMGELGGAAPTGADVDAARKLLKEQ